MKASLLCAALGAVALGASTHVWSQDSITTPSPDSSSTSSRSTSMDSSSSRYGRWDDADGDSRPKGWLPYTSYGYFGANFGSSDYDLGGCAPGTSCEGNNFGFKVYGGGQLTRMLGLELSYVDLGTVGRNNGDTWARGLNLGLVANAPMGPVNVFAKLGGVYGWTHQSSPIAGVATGKNADLDISYGLGAQFDVTRKLAIRGDWDVYRLTFASGRENVALYSLGVVYKY